MEVFRFGPETGKPIRQFESQALMSKICHTTSETRMSCVHLDTDGLIGFHEAKVPQLMLVVSGNATVSTADKTDEVGVGDAVFWKEGEHHQTTSTIGMTALIIESETLNPNLLRK
ncbi:cupin [Alkalicoccobacillus plakortidis]|uniref:Cupin n=1 Tax=Alkalicoccobacillus plakortidis TaxID=444060 RepID=A0ABT0XGV6_9BACI|nr:cupin [Alkalicoccobacillus plakortidis]MCM2674935.1 cupin [Alkalicoccobacillus plakortidis]